MTDRFALDFTHDELVILIQQLNHRVVEIGQRTPPGEPAGEFPEIPLYQRLLAARNEAMDKGIFR